MSLNKSLLSFITDKLEKEKNTQKKAKPKAPVNKSQTLTEQPTDYGSVVYPFKHGGSTYSAGVWYQDGGEEEQEDPLRKLLLKGIDKAGAYALKGAKWVGKTFAGTDDIVPDFVKESIYNRIRPVSYPTDVRQAIAEYTRSDRAKPTKDLEGDPSMDEEAWSRVLRRPTKSKYFVPSKNRPSNAQDPNAEYWQLAPGVLNEQLMKNVLNNNYFSRNAKKTKDGLEYVELHDLEPFMSKKFMRDYNKYAQMPFDQTDPLSNYQVFRGVDKKTGKPFLSIKDTYDFGLETANEMIKPMEIYHRIYAEGGEPEYTGSSIVDYLTTKGLPTNKKFRSQLADQLGMEGYDYSAAKNLELLDRLREDDQSIADHRQAYAPIPVEQMIEMEKERGVYAHNPMDDEAPVPAPVVAPRPVAKKKPVQMPPMFDSRAILQAPTGDGSLLRPQAQAQFPGMWNQQEALKRIAGYVPAAKKATLAIPKPKARPNVEEVSEAPVNPRSVYNPQLITGPSVPGDSLGNWVDGVKDIWEKGMNYLDRSSALKNENLKERKSSIKIDPKATIDNAPIYMTGDTISDAHGRYHLPEVMDLNHLRFGIRNRGDYRPIDSEAGSITAFNPFTPAKQYFAGSKDPANATYIGIDAQGRPKVGGRKDFENTDYQISKTFGNKIVDFNRNPDGSIAKVPSNPKASKETLSPSVKVLGDDGKIVNGKMSILLPRKGDQERSFDLVTGGRYIMMSPDGKQFEMVSGSLKDIESRFNKIKKGNPYVNVVSLDNGSYARGLRTKSGQMTSKDLKRYDNQNTEGGNFLYLRDDSPRTRYESKFNEFQQTAQSRLQKLYPGKKVEVRFENEGVYDKKGSRDIESQAAILKKGHSQASYSMHNFDAARDYALYVDGKRIPADKQKNVYKNVLWNAADAVGMYHLDDWDPVHIGLVKEGEKTGFNELQARYPEIFKSRTFQKSLQFIEKNKNNPAYKEAYQLLHNIKPWQPKPKKEYGGSWLEKYN